MSGRRWPEETEAALRRFGWYPGRSAPTATWEFVLREHDGFAMHDAARRFLEEFGGLRLMGWVQAQHGNRWWETPLDPTLAKWDHEIFEELSDQAGAYLYPIGMEKRNSLYLGIAPDGTVYRGMDYVEHFAADGDTAMERLVAWFIGPSRG